VTSTKRLDQVASIIMGQAPAGESYNTTGDGWPLIAGAGDFKNGKLAPVKHTIQASKLSEPGDIILSIRASIGDKVTADDVYCLGRGVAGIRAAQLLSPRYLWHWLTSVETELANKGRGATFKQVNRSDIGELIIPIPLLAEQKRIAEVLDQADSLRVRRKQAIALVDELTQSVFLDMFGDPVSNPMGWPVKKFAALVREFRYGTSNKSSREGLPALRIPNVVGGKLDLDNLKLVPVTEAEEGRLRLMDGDLLFVRSNGNPTYVGRCAVFSERDVQETGYAPHKFIYASYLIRARLNLAEASPDYIQAFLSSGVGKSALRERAKTSAGQFNVNIEGIGSILVPCPPAEAQKEFAHRLKGIREIGQVFTKGMVSLDELFDSLLGKAFRGEL
jgi:type I restriction enzyme S subunit